MNRRKFIEYSIKTIALASVPVINFFPKVNISEDVIFIDKNIREF